MGSRIDSDTSRLSKPALERQIAQKRAMRLIPMVSIDDVSMAGFLQNH
jgi:hypothetical protein